jgi:hypothetical protein
MSQFVVDCCTYSNANTNRGSNVATVAHQKEKAMTKRLLFNTSIRLGIRGWVAMLIATGSAQAGYHGNNYPHKPALGSTGLQSLATNHKHRSGEMLSPEEVRYSKCIKPQRKLA